MFIQFNSQFNVIHNLITFQGVETMSAETVSSAMATVTLDDAASDAGDAIYTSELRGSDEAGEHLNPGDGFWVKI